MNERFRRRHLPHVDVLGGTYFVTSCLAGSISARGLLDIEQYVRNLERRDRPSELTDLQWEKQKSKLLFARRDRWLDLEPAVRYFDDHRLCVELQDSLYHFADERYDLIAYVIMPSHFHWLFRPKDDWVASLGPSAEERSPRERIMQSIKRHTGFVCSRLITGSKQFWQDESYDHVVECDEELSRIIEYIELNPVKAGLIAEREMWRFSSSYDRAIALGGGSVRPLTKVILGEVRRKTGVGGSETKGID